MRLLMVFLLLFSAASAEEPWGEGASLVRPKVEAGKSGYTGGPLSRAAQGLIRFHQVVVSPADGPRSHFYPCSSQYALNAIRKHGLFNGFCMGCDRLMRENHDPWFYRQTCRGGEWIKYDPVP